MTVEVIREDDVLTMMVQGSVDTNTAPQLESEIKEEMDGIRELILDFTGVKYIASAGLRTLLAVHKAMQKTNGRMVIRGVNEQVWQTLVITGFTRKLSVKRSERLHKNKGAE